jgi:hypothetical protein
MKKLIRETAEEILQEYTNCYSEADEDCLVKMLEKLASNMAREIFEEIDKFLKSQEALSENKRLKEVGDWIFHDYLPSRLADLKKKYESEGADDV